MSTSTARDNDIARRLVLHGHVQGVFFRASTRDLAREHGVVGWVRNDPRGTVTMHLEGGRDAVEQLVAWARGGGPSRARVERVEVDDVASEGHEGFTVRR